MALLPPHFLNSVVAIGSVADNDPDTEAQWTGTGFFYGAPADGSADRVVPFLVTNRHVLDGKNAVVVKMNRADDLPAGQYRLDLESARHLVTAHPGGADVAVVPARPEIWVEDQAMTSFTREEQVLSREKAQEIGVSEGDGVFAIGFPMGLVGYEDQIFPIVRQGCLARVQDWLSGRADTILIDASIFPGNSGGPVFLRPSTVAIEGTKSNLHSYLIGMVSAYIPYRNVSVSLQTGRAMLVLEENSGVAEIVPGDAITETVRVAMHRIAESNNAK